MIVDEEHSGGGDACLLKCGGGDLGAYGDELLYTTLDDERHDLATDFLGFESCLLYIA